MALVTKLVDELDLARRRAAAEAIAKHPDATLADVIELTEQPALRHLQRLTVGELLGL
jgi:hypothetical protein